MLLKFLTIFTLVPYNIYHTVVPEACLLGFPSVAGYDAGKISYNFYPGSLQYNIYHTVVPEACLLGLPSVAGLDGGNIPYYIYPGS